MKWIHYSNSDHEFIMIANQKNESEYNVRSSIFSWNGDYRTFTHFNTLDTTGASDLVHLEILLENQEKLKFLVVSNFYPLG